jgi:Lectin C-type domain
LLVHLTRLNVPCTTGGYLAFRDHNPSNRNSSGQQKLCGKLEEFSPNERTFYYPSHNQTSVRIVNSPLFSLNYKLVDYCYNMTLSDRRRTFLLRPHSTLECYFKIHLPFGNRIAFDMITNSDSDSLSNRSPTNNTREYIDLGAVAVAAPTSSSSGGGSPAHKSDSKILFQKCDGISIQISNMAKHNHWHGCVEAHSPMRFYSILSDTNILVIRVVKSVVDSQMLAAPTSRVPSLYMEYSAHPVESIVSQCAFGWIALSQFCVTAIERAVDWPTAESECNKLGGHLVSIRSENDQKLIDQLLFNSPGYRENSAYWVGATDKLYEGDFRWVDSLPFTFSSEPQLSFPRGRH